MSEGTEEGVLTLAREGGITFFGNIVGKFLGFAFVVAATRLVTPTEYGLFTLGLSIVLFVQGFVSLNVHRSVDYFLPQYLEESDGGRAAAVLRKVFVIGVSASAVGTVAVVAASGLISSVFEEPNLALLLPVLALLIPIQTVFMILVASFNGIKVMKYRVLMKNVLNPLVRTLVAVALVYAGIDALGLVGGQIAGVAFASVVGAYLFFREVDWIRDPQRSTIPNRTLLSYSLPLVLAGVIYSLVGQIDYFIIGYYLSAADVGQYQVAYLLAANLLIVLSAVTPVFKPLIAENTGDDRYVGEMYSLATRWVTMLTLPIAITIALAPDAYLTLLFTDSYSAAAMALVALCVGYLLNASFGPEGMVLEGLGYTRLTLLNSTVLVGTNAVLDILLVPRLGIVGAGIATGTALTVAGVVGVAEIRFLRGCQPFTAQLIRVWTAAVPAFVLGWVASRVLTGLLPLTAGIPLVVGATYVAGLRATGGFTEDDVKLAERFDRILGYSVATPIVAGRSEQ
jgi:O-antigen/teichoic acid export membrane protein